MSDLFETSGWKEGGIRATSTAAHTAPDTVSATSPTGIIVTEGYRGIRLMVIGTAADDDIDFAIYGVERSYSSGRGDIEPMYITRELATVDDLLGGVQAGAAGALVNANEFFFDVYPALSVSPYMTTMLNIVNGTIGAVTTTGGIGFYFITDLGNMHGIVPQLNATADSVADYIKFLFILDK